MLRLTRVTYYLLCYLLISPTTNTNYNNLMLVHEESLIDLQVKSLTIYFLQSSVDNLT